MRSLFIFISFIGACCCTLPTLEFAVNVMPADPKIPFAGKPLRVEEAKKLGYARLRGCEDNPQIKGEAYSSKDDKSTTILYNANGDVAGVHFAIPSVEPLKDIPNPPFVTIGGVIGGVVYFEEPETICKQKPSTPDFELYLQTSLSPKESTKIPRLEKDLDLKRFTKCSCVPGIGVHYSLSFGVEFKCNLFAPLLFVYVNGQLSAIATGILLPPRTVPLLPATFPQLFVDLFLGAAPKCPRNSYLSTSIYIFVDRRVKLPTCAIPRG